MRAFIWFRRFVIKSAHKDHGVLYTAGFFLFFWALFDGILSFTSPLLMAERGLSDSVIGLVIGFSSIGGAFFDLLLYRLLPSSNFRRVFLAVLAVSLFFPLVLWHATVLWAYLLAMALWGLYYDLHTIGVADFISRHPAVNTNKAGDFSVAGAFSGLGYLVAPLIAGYLVSETVGTTPFFTAFLFLGISAIFYAALFAATRKDPCYTTDKPRRSIRLYREFKLWMRLGPAILPALFLTLCFDAIDAFYWTIGPLFAEEMGLGPLAGIFLAAYTLPPLLLAWFVGSITEHFGEERTAAVSLLVASTLLVSFAFITNPFALVCMAFLVACCSGLAIPAAAGAVSDYIDHKREYATEIETVQDTFVNSGWVIGPVAAGLLSEYFGYGTAFAFLGVAGFLVAVAFLQFAPRLKHS